MARKKAGVDLISLIICTMGAFVMLTVLLYVGTQNDIPDGEGF